jgi:hypothetical protein
MRFYNQQAKEIRSNNMKQWRDIARRRSTTQIPDTQDHGAGFLKMRAQIYLLTV